MDVKVVRGECSHICHSEEQLKTFIAAGWQAVEESAAAKKKATKEK